MGEWTFKNVAAHLTSWRAHEIGELEAAAQGVDPPPDPWPAELTTNDTINQWIYEPNRSPSAGDVAMMPFSPIDAGCASRAGRH